jgi:hypothetical protein
VWNEDDGCDSEFDHVDDNADCEICSTLKQKKPKKESEDAAKVCLRRTAHASP